MNVCVCLPISANYPSLSVCVCVCQIGMGPSPSEKGFIMTDAPPNTGISEGERERTNTNQDLNESESVSVLLAFWIGVFSSSFGIGDNLTRISLSPGEGHPTGRQDMDLQDWP